MGARLSYNATLIERVDLSPALAIFRVEPDDPPPAGQWFVPGQYMTMGMNNADEPSKGSVRRPMSIASPPIQRSHLDFYIRWIGKPESDNPLTHLLWKLDVGERLFVRPKAVGKFTLRDTLGDDESRLRVFVAAGTGLAPFTSILLDMAEQDPNVDLGNFAVLHAASYPPEIGYRAELESLSRNNGLKYAPSVSRPTEAPEWQGHCGRVEDFFLPERLDALEALLQIEGGAFNPRNCAVFICGLAGTMRNTLERCFTRGFMTDHRKIRRALGVPQDWPASIFSEPYDSEPPLDVRDPENVQRLVKMLPW